MTQDELIRAAIGNGWKRIVPPLLMDEFVSMLGYLAISISGTAWRWIPSGPSQWKPFHKSPDDSMPLEYRDLMSTPRSKLAPIGVNRENVLRDWAWFIAKDIPIYRGIGLGEEWPELASSSIADTALPSEIRLFYNPKEDVRRQTQLLADMTMRGYDLPYEVQVSNQQGTRGRLVESAEKQLLVREIFAAVRSVCLEYNALGWE
jgi:hypothetical protein